MSDRPTPSPKIDLRAAGVMIALGLAAIVYFWAMPKDLDTPTAQTPESSVVASPPPTAAPTPPAPSKPEPPPLPPAKSSLALADRLNNPNLPASEDVRTLFSISDSYFTNMQNRQGAPIRDDIDLVKVLTGKNPLRLTLLPSDHRAISPEGRLLDRWGTPYFIHPRSGRLLEIHSAGPDKIMFSSDDLIAPPLEAQRVRDY